MRDAGGPRSPAGPPGRATSTPCPSPPRDVMCGQPSASRLLVTPLTQRAHPGGVRRPGPGQPGGEKAGQGGRAWRCCGDTALSQGPERPTRPASCPPCSQERGHLPGGPRGSVELKAPWPAVAAECQETASGPSGRGAAVGLAPFRSPLPTQSQVPYLAGQSGPVLQRLVLLPSVLSPPGSPEEEGLPQIPGRTSLTVPGAPTGAWSWGPGSVGWGHALTATFAPGA